MTRGQEGLAELRDRRVVAVIRSPSKEDAVAVGDALVACGVTALEVTFTVPDAAAAIAVLAERHAGRALVGAGTVRTPLDAHAAAAAGARFLVSPGTVPGVLDAMRQTGLTVIAGVLTPSELMGALDGGAHAAKLFPAGQFGPGYLKALRAPFPDACVVPTGGVTAETAGAWLEAGAWAVGVGGALAPPVVRSDADRAALAERVAPLLAAVAA